MAFVQAISPTEFPLEISYWEAEFPPKYPHELAKMYIQGCSSQHCSSLEKTGNHPNVHP